MTESYSVISNSGRIDFHTVSKGCSKLCAKRPVHQMNDCHLHPTRFWYSITPLDDRRESINKLCELLKVSIHLLLTDSDLMFDSDLATVFTSIQTSLTK